MIRASNRPMAGGRRARVTSRLRRPVRRRTTLALRDSNQGGWTSRLGGLAGAAEAGPVSRHVPATFCGFVDGHQREGRHRLERPPAHSTGWVRHPGHGVLAHLGDRPDELEAAIGAGQTLLDDVRAVVDPSE